MTYNVFCGTLNLAQSINLSDETKVTSDKLQRLLNAAARVVTVACRGFCTPHCIGWMYLSQVR